MDALTLPALTHPELDEQLSRACLRVEHYLCSLRIRNKRILHELTHAMLGRVRERLLAEPGLAPEAAVMEEIERHLSVWYARVTGRSEPPELLATSVRLSFFNSDLADKWSVWFLREGPWPEDFVEELRRAELRAHPDALPGPRMVARPLDLGSMGELADETWRLFGKWPLLGVLAVAAAYLLVFALILLFIA